MTRSKTPIPGPLTLAEIQRRVELSRQLVSLAAHQHSQAKLNLELAAVGLAELKTDLALRGLAGGEP
jgi:hypothetical protein